MAAVRIVNEADEDDEESYLRAVSLALSELDTPGKNRKHLGIQELFLDQESRDTVSLLCRYSGLREHRHFPAPHVLASAFLGPAGDVSVPSFIQRVELE